MIKKMIWPILSAFFLLSTSSFAQRYEYGIGVGMLTYTGDLDKGFFAEPSLGLQAIYRINVDPDVAFKFSALYGQIKGTDSSSDPFSTLRNTSFERTIAEGTVTFEYHFLDYKNEKSTIRWSPYFFTGIGFMKIFDLDEEVDNFSSLQTILPVGIGFKHLIGKQFSAGVEFGARKTFFDDLDGISDGNLFDKNYQYGNPNDKDWYHFIGFTFSYILYKIPCNYRYIPNRSLYKRGKD